MSYRAQLEAALGAVELYASGGFSWRGQRVPPLSRAWREALSAPSQRAPLVRSLSERLYEDFYCRGGDLEGVPVSATFDGDRIQFRQRLARAGWGVRSPRWLAKLSPGFSLAIGERDLPDGIAPVVRLYFHLSPRGAIRWVRAATSRLTEAGARYRLKVCDDPRLYGRADAVVLWLAGNDYPALRPLLRELYHPLSMDLCGSVPALTKAVAPGVGLAEEPHDGGSFGLHRCRLLAEGMVRAREEGRMKLADRLEGVLLHFREHGVDPERPFLNHGSRDAYPFLVPRPSAGRPEPLPRHVDPLALADRIAWTLTRQAFWHQERCNWLGRVEGDDGVRARSTLGPEVYGGTSGIALFLGELASLTRDSATRRTALGAIHHALSHADAVPPAHRLGLFTGCTGIALVAVRLAELLGEEVLAQKARSLLRRLPRGDSVSVELLSGNAGAVLGLLALAEDLGSGLLERANDLGREILRAGKWSGDGLSWRTGLPPARRRLTGFAHGAAGIALALFELWDRTGDERFRRAGDGALRYERRFFDEARGNWADLRRGAAKPRRGFVTGWCHGAPGIALSRLRAWELTGERAYAEEASVALETTRKWVESALEPWVSSTNLSTRRSPDLAQPSPIPIGIGDAPSLARCHHPLRGILRRRRQQRHHRHVRGRRELDDPSGRRAAGVPAGGGVRQRGLRRGRRPRRRAWTGRRWCDQGPVSYLIQNGLPVARGARQLAAWSSDWVPAGTAVLQKGSPGVCVPFPSVST
jgi:hypothetical protein